MSAKALFLKSGDVAPEDILSSGFENISEEELNRPFTFDQKKRVAEKVTALSKDAHLEIFFLLKKHGAKYTSNHNGMFFNINSISNDVLNRLEKLVEFCHQNEKNLAKSYDKRFTSHPDTPSKSVKVEPSKEKEVENSDETSEGESESSEESATEDSDSEDSNEDEEEDEEDEEDGEIEALSKRLSPRKKGKGKAKSKQATKAVAKEKKFHGSCARVLNQIKKHA